MITECYLYLVAPEKSYIQQKGGLFTRKVIEEVKVDVHGALVKKQDTEEEDIDELVRTFKESEASVPKDTGNAGGYSPDNFVMLTEICLLIMMWALLEKIIASKRGWK